MVFYDHARLATQMLCDQQKPSNVNGKVTANEGPIVRV